MGLTDLNFMMRHMNPSYYPFLHVCSAFIAVFKPGVSFFIHYNQEVNDNIYTYAVATKATRQLQANPFFTLVLRDLYRLN